jgi:hypothetical protein
VPWTLVRVDADSVGPLDADGRSWKLGEFTGGLASWLDADLVSRNLPQALRTRLQDLSLPTTACTRRELFYRISHRLEPALHDASYEPIPPGPPQTITDTFNRANEVLTAGSWVEIEGTNWEVVSNQARETTAVGVSTCRRSEATFPDDQYAQSKCKFTAGGASTPAGRVGATGTSYLVLLDADSVDLYWHAGGGSSTLITSAAATQVSGTLYTIKIICTGTTIAVDREGSNVISTTDSNVTAGKPGMASNNANQDQDDFECTDATTAFLARQAFIARQSVKRASYW